MSATEAGVDVIDRGSRSAALTHAFAEGTGDAGTFGVPSILEWQVSAPPESRVVVVVPQPRTEGERFPVLIALHGRGEAHKPPGQGALGWVVDYALLRAMQRISSPPLQPEDYEGFVEPDQLLRANHSLRQYPYAGLIVVCPYVPDLDLHDEAAIGAYARWLIDEVLPPVRQRTPAFADPSHTGIDGVSLGGAMALHVGLMYPDQFGSIGTLQPAIDSSEAGLWAERARGARARNPELRLRLLTSHDDYFREAVRGASMAWRNAGVDHDFAEVVGPHDYPFNRGPGAIEMLLWHDRVLTKRSRDE